MGAPVAVAATQLLKTFEQVDGRIKEEEKRIEDAVETEDKKKLSALMKPGALPNMQTYQPERYEVLIPSLENLDAIRRSFGPSHVIFTNTPTKTHEYTRELACTRAQTRVYKHKHTRENACQQTHERTRMFFFAYRISWKKCVLLKLWLTRRRPSSRSNRETWRKSNPTEIPTPWF